MNHVLMRRCCSAATSAVAQSSRYSTRRRIGRSQQLFARSNSSSKPPINDEEEEHTEWIPPNRPLAGDKGRSDLYDTSTAVVEEMEEDTSIDIDWLSTRRAKQQPTSMDLPDRNRKFAGAELEVLEGRLLSADEIEQCLTSMGVLDYKLIELTEDRQKERMGGGGVEGIILVTATSPRHLKLVSDTLVRQLKIRKLAQRGVVGAELGADGGEDWSVLDCRNYIVHMMLEKTRQHLNLEALWTGEDELLNLKYNDEATMDNYVARNPVPEGFGQVFAQDVSDTVSKLQRWNMGHKSVIAKPKRKHGNKKSKRGPRLL